MGRKALHTQEQIFQAADELAATGKEVTPSTLREALGGGSLTTIYKHIDAWRETRKSAPVPIELQMPDSVKAAFSQCWHAAASEAGKEIAAIREKADAEIKVIKRQLDEAINAIEQLEAEGEADSTKLEQVEADLALALNASQKEATEASAREAALTATVNELRKQIEAQQAELISVHAEAEAGRKQHEAELSRITADFNRQLSDQSSSIQSLHDTTNRLRRQIDETEQKLDAAISRERAKIEEAAKASANADRVTEQLKDQKVRNAEVIGKLEKDKQTLEAELSSTRNECRELNIKMNRAVGELDALRTQVVEQSDVIKRFADQGQGDKKTK